MYLKPFSIAQKFLLCTKQSRISDGGREIINFKPTGEILLGIISSHTPQQLSASKGIKHKATVSIVQRSGNVKASIGDLLINADRKFLVTARNEAAAGWTIYKVSERFDISV